MSTTGISLRLSRGRAYTYWLTGAYFAAFVALGLTTGSLGPTLPSLAEQTQVSLSGISLIFTVRSLGYVLSSVRVGNLFDRGPGNAVMAAMLLTMSVMTIMVPLASRFWLLLLAMFVLGAAEAGLDVGANALMSRVHGTGVAPFMNALHSFFGVGALIAPVIVAQTVSFNLSATHSYFVVAVLLLPISLFLLRLPSPGRTVAVRAKDDPKDSALLIFLIALFLFLYVGAEVGFAGWIFTYATKLQLSDARMAAYLTSLFWGSLTIGRVLTIPAAARVRPRKILMLSLAGSILSLAVMLLKPSSTAVTYVGTTILGLSMASIFPATLSFAGNRMKLTGRVTGWFVFGASAGSMLIPLIAGQAFAAFGPQVIMIVFITMLLTAVGVFACMIRHSPAQERLLH